MQAKFHEDKRPTTARPRRELHAGTRTCTGCARRVEADGLGRELLRIALLRDAEGVYEAHADVAQSSFGRGAWVHARRDCLEKAAARGLARSAKGRVRADATSLSAEIVSQAERRAWALLGSARRARKVAVGTDAVSAALRGDEVALLVVAGDARSAIAQRDVAEAIGAGRAIVLGDKGALGAAFDRETLAVVAVLDRGIAEALVHAASLIATFDHPLHPQSLSGDDEIGPDSGARQ